VVLNVVWEENPPSRGLPCSLLPPASAGPRECAPAPRTRRPRGEEASPAEGCSAAAGVSGLRCFQVELRKHTMPLPSPGPHWLFPSSTFSRKFSSIPLRSCC